VIRIYTPIDKTSPAANFYRRTRTLPNQGQDRSHVRFGFDEPRRPCQTRGDKNRRGRDYSLHVLQRRARMSRSFLRS